MKDKVAVPAQPDRRDLQQAGVCAAVGLVAVEAILHDRRMLKNERTPVLSVTVEAKLIIGKSFYELGRGSPVRVVAIHAGHFSLAQRMMRKPHLIGDLLFMTYIARIVYGYTRELMTARHSRFRVDRVALRAPDVLDVMRTSLPEHLLLLLMAL